MDPTSKTYTLEKHTPLYDLYIRPAKKQDILAKHHFATNLLPYLNHDENITFKKEMYGMLPDRTKSIKVSKNVQEKWQNAYDELISSAKKTAQIRANTSLDTSNNLNKVSIRYRPYKKCTIPRAVWKPQFITIPF